MTGPQPNPLPRELVPGLFWLGDCLHFPDAWQGQGLHGYHSVYVVAGRDHTVIVEGGHPRDLPVIESQLEQLLAAEVAEPSHIFTTHTETPHSAGVGRYLARFAELQAVGDISDLHLVFPQFAARMSPMAVGDRIDLGDTELVVVEAVFRDYHYTRWLFDTRRRVLFAGDGFSYSHYHQAGQCGMTAEEVPDLDLPGMTSQFAELAFAWTRYVDIEPYLARLDQLLFEELGVAVVAPTHGLPIMDPTATIPAVRDGLRLGSAGPAAWLSR